MSELTSRFRQLHESGTFMMPNPWDIGSARYLQWRGFPALATTSAGLAASLGRMDQTVTRDELLTHVEALARAITVPLNVDSERCYADDVAGIGRTIELLASAGASGCSIEDYDPLTGQIDELDLATERVAAAAEAAADHDLVLTARAEQHLYGQADLDDTVARLVAYRRAGAEVVYAPGLAAVADITRLVEESGAPVNVLALPAVPPVGELTRLGVRRVSTGGGLAWSSYGALKAAVDELAEQGTFGYSRQWLPREDRIGAFGPRIGS
jgi:2-methylisocitrate lyase-like PEP mutase family enzyme